MKDSRSQGISSLTKYFKKYRHYFLWGVVVLIGANGFTLVWPWLLKEGIDRLETGTIDSTGLLQYAGAIVGAALVAAVFRFFARRTIIWASRYIEYDLRNEFFSHLLRLPASFYQKTPTGDIIARASNDMDAIRMMIGPAVMYLINAVLIAVSVFTMLIIISPTLTLYSLIPLPLLTLLMWQIGQQVHKRFKRIQDHFSLMSSFVQENLSGVRVIKAYRREKHRGQRFRDINDKYVNLNMSLFRVRAFFMPSIGFLAGTILLIVLWAGGRQVVAGLISLGDLIAFSVYLQMLIWPMLSFGFVISLYQRGTASLNRVNQILNQEPEISERTVTLSERSRGGISFDGLHFTYPGTSEPVLRDVSFKVEPGRRVAIVGATGSGKSTLVSLLMRKFPVPDGTVLLDGVDINRLPLDDLRSQVGFVPQESYLFSDTIEANIGFSETQSDSDRVQEVAVMAAFDSEVADLPHKYQTVLGERGITLSGGQKQRAAIARALLKKPPILIFDDAFSSVDTQTEESILENLTAYSDNATILLISHRPSTIKRADMIVVLHKGTIVETGTHDELVAKQGRYYDIIRRQLLASELELLN